MRATTYAFLAALSAASVTSEAAAQAIAEGAETAAGISARPLLTARARAEFVEQGVLEAEAVTVRVRAGAEVRRGPFSALLEGEATVALALGYNAFPFAAHNHQWRPAHAVVPDPENLELNRFQVEYRTAASAITGGRQRIDLDDQRWVGSVGWRQNEQTFDAVRAVTKIGPVSADLTYSLAQRTIFGVDAGSRTALAGDFVFAGIAASEGPVTGKVFSYLISYEEPLAFANSSQTYGGYLTAAVPVGSRAKLNLRASYARQSDYGANPFDYAAGYWSLDAAAKLAEFDLAAGIEILGSDNGRGLQTPLATLHKFNGWADVFLTTPPAGLQDLHFSLARNFPGLRAVPGLHASVAAHRFRSAAGLIRYGHEFDALIGARFKSVAALIKYARYEACGFGSDTRKLWLQLEFTL